MFYPDDFASDGKVEAMTSEGVGCYILLLCKAWRENPAGTIPADDRLLARWARVSDERWAALRPEVLSPFEPCNDGRLVQKRLRSEYEKQRRSRRARSLAGKLGAAATWQKHGNAIGDALAEESEYESESENLNRSKKVLVPTVEEVSKYCAERNNKIDAQQFVDFYTTNGWVQGRSGKPIRDWQAAVRTWEKNGLRYAANGTEPKRKLSERGK
jgi:uncharacterized protein YdaU (DUF1376 family)